MHQVVELYKHRVLEHHTINWTIIPVEDYFYDTYSTFVTLNCWNLVVPCPGFSFQGNSYQYDLRRYNGTKPKAWRVPFLMDPNYNNPNYTVSHLCHNPDCYNWNHHVLEPLEVNKGRNGCPGGTHCHHQIPCIRPGPYFNM